MQTGRELPPSGQNKKTKRRNCSGLRHGGFHCVTVPAPGSRLVCLLWCRTTARPCVIGYSRADRFSRGLSMTNVTSADYAGSLEYLDKGSEAQSSGVSWG